MMSESHKEELKALIHKIALNMTKEILLEKNADDVYSSDLYELQDYLHDFFVVNDGLSMELPDGSIVSFKDLAQ
jgi:hypothetical protein